MSRNWGLLSFAIRMCEVERTILSVLTIKGWMCSVCVGRVCLGLFQWLLDQGGGGSTMIFILTSWVVWSFITLKLVLRYTHKRTNKDSVEKPCIERKRNRQIHKFRAFVSCIATYNLLYSCHSAETHQNQKGGEDKTVSDVVNGGRQRWQQPEPTFLFCLEDITIKQSRACCSAGKSCYQHHHPRCHTSEGSCRRTSVRRVQGQDQCLWPRRLVSRIHPASAVNRRLGCSGCWIHHLWAGYPDDRVPFGMSVIGAGCKNLDQKSPANFFQTQSVGWKGCGEHHERVHDVGAPRSMGGDDVRPKLNSSYCRLLEAHYWLVSSFQCERRGLCSHLQRFQDLRDRRTRTSDLFSDLSFVFHIYMVWTSIAQNAHAGLTFNKAV